MKNNSFIAGLLAVAAFLGGCSDAGTPASQTPAPAAPPAVTAVATAPTATAGVATAVTATAEVPAVPVYSYNPMGRRDPFTPLIIREEKKALVGAKTPLERYAIYEFKLTGIVWGGLGYHAMLEGPDGKGYFVKTGAVIGSNQGVVKKINPNAMIVEERYRDPSGELQKKEIIIELRKKQEGTP